MPEEDRYAYAEGVRRGGTVVSVRTTDADYDRALEILDARGGKFGGTRSNLAQRRLEGIQGRDYRDVASSLGASTATSSSAAKPTVPPLTSAPATSLLPERTR